MFGNFSNDVLNTEAAWGAGTIKASIRRLRDGAESVNAEGETILPNGNKYLHFPTVDIRDGDEVLVNILQKNDNGPVYTQFQSDYCAHPLDGYLSGTGTPFDPTQGTSAPANVITVFPRAVLAMTCKPSVLFVGSSSIEGGQEGRTDYSGDTGLGPRSVGRLMGYTSIANAGSLLGHLMAASRKYRDEILPHVSHVWQGYGTNDLATGDTPAQMALRDTDYAAACRLVNPSLSMIKPTLQPYNTSTDGWATLANQTGWEGSGTNGKLRLYLNLIRSGLAGYDVIMEMADIIDPFRIGKFIVTRNSNDAMRSTVCTFSGSQIGTTLTVLSVVNGSLSIGDPVISQLSGPYGADNLEPSSVVLDQLTGVAGGIGTYRLNKAKTVSTRTMYVGGFATADGLHVTAAVSEMVRDRLNIAAINR
ncbi:hypothetical protein GCM10010924_12080 [Rhizobium wenxiniae]|nr:hypothetical protein GCM10010924_12080 [Rhizobium wenxiniae]